MFLCVYPQCSFLPRFLIEIETKYEDNNGSTENVSVYSLMVNTGRLNCIHNMTLRTIQGHD